MNKRQRKKQEKKLRIKRLNSPNIEIGDTVEIIQNSYSGLNVGTLGIVIDRMPTRDKLEKSDLYISGRMNPFDPFGMIHHRKDLKLIRKGH